MNEPADIGLTDEGKDKLKILDEENYFKLMVDGYRFSIAIAIAHRQISSTSGFGTIFHTKTVDPDDTIYWSIKALYPELTEPIYKTAERLAEWGVNYLYGKYIEDDLSIIDIMESVLIPSEQEK